MDKKTRVLNCIDNKPIDKVPFTFWHHYHGEEAQGKLCVDMHKRLYDETGIDYIKMMSDGFFPVDYGVSKIETPSDWAKVKVPAANSAWVQGQIDRIKWMREAIKDEACVFYVMFSAFEFLGISFGRDLCTTHLKDEESRQYMLPVLEAMGDLVAETGAKLITEAGATGVHQSFSHNYRFTGAEYETLMKPQDKKLVKAVNAAGNYNILHLCGWDGKKNNMDVWLDYKGAVVHWDQHTDKLPIEEAQYLFKDMGRALMGGFDNKVGTFFYTAGKEDIKAVAKNYARIGGKTGFLLSADCSLNEAFDYERIRWVREALEELAAE